jgi:hypothetical protein
VRSGSQFPKIQPWAIGQLSIWEVWGDSVEGSIDLVSPIETLNHYLRSTSAVWARRSACGTALSGCRLDAPSATLEDPSWGMKRSLAIRSTPV